MNTYTTIGYFEGSPHEPLCFTVKADNPVGAIKESERCAKAILNDGKSVTFINTFVFEGQPNLLTSWAG